jgi:hypothetical protein
MTNKQQAIKERYLNPKQLKFQKSRAKRKTFQGGRGSGKTYILGVDQYECFWQLPGMVLLLGGLTYVQLDMVVLPGIVSALRSVGFVEYSKSTPWGVFVIGKMPPDNWAKCRQQIGKRGYQYCISFINGYTIRFVSQDNPDTHRGINSVAVRVDESATMNEDFINTVLLPTMRDGVGNKVTSSHKYRSYYDFSSASWTPEGNWIYKTEERYLTMMEERAKMDAAQKLEIPPSVLFLQSTFRDNQANLPDDYGDMLFQSLPELSYMVEVENQRITKLPNCFYYAFNSAKHSYTKSFDYEYDDKIKLHVYRSNDYRTDNDLEVSLDFNADISWIVTCQDSGREFRVIDSQFEKVSVLDPNKNVVTVNAQKWCDKYKSHEKKTVHVWGDKSGTNRNATSGGDNLTFFSQAVKVLEDNGWKVIKHYLKQAPNPKHKDKYILTNYLLEEQSERTPKLRFNQNTNKALIIAMGRTPIMTDGSYRKSKNAETAGDGITNREFAPDGTDALDYIIWNKFRKHMPTASVQRNQLDTI